MDVCNENWTRSLSWSHAGCIDTHSWMDAKHARRHVACLPTKFACRGRACVAPVASNQQESLLSAFWFNYSIFSRIVTINIREPIRSHGNACVLRNSKQMRRQYCIESGAINKKCRLESLNRLKETLDAICINLIRTIPFGSLGECQIFYGDCKSVSF